MVFNPADKDKNKPAEEHAVHGMYENWFLDYASYVILERAVPSIEDGLKPVQRRIMHAMYEMEDGRYNKVANIIGQTMQYHPHGDASIADAIIALGQKDLLIDTQGNWGDIRTGDSAAAPRYIEARLSKFALEVVFNPQTTTWQLSYDGRKREPLTLPVKFPLLLAQGVDGIAVGLSTRVLPHNFVELLRASIDILRNKPVTIFPDFQTGGYIDVSEYNDGKRGGKVRVRARIEELDKKTLVIKDIPYATTTGGIIESIIKANDNGKIKIRKVEDNTAKDVEIVVHLAQGVSPDVTIDALYAFTDCQISISPNCCVIYDNKPHFLGVTELLRINTQQTVNLLKRELEIKLGELEEDWHMSSLEKIFIEKRIYRDIEEATTWEDVIARIHAGLKKYKKLFFRDITDEDVVKLTEIKIKRISKYDSFKADEHIKQVEADIAQTKHDLANLRDFAIKYYENLIKKYGKDRERKTEIRSFETIKAQQVALANTKLYVNREDGFIGTGLKKDEFAFECSDLDDIIVFTSDGKMSVNKVSEKTFVGKGVIWLDVFKKNDDKTVYHMIYRDGRLGQSMVKRFTVGGVTRNKEYNLTRGTDGTKVHWFSVNQNGETEVVNVFLTPTSGARKKEFTFDFAKLEVKGREAKGNVLTKYPVRKVSQHSRTEAEPVASEIFYDPQFGRLNVDGKGNLLGEFHQGDLILAIYNDGNYELTDYALTHRFEPTKTLVIEKFNPQAIITALYFDGKAHFLKRFQIETNTVDRKFLFIPEHKDAKVLVATTDEAAKIKILEGGKRSSTERTINPVKFIDVKGWKANGIRVTDKEIQNVELVTKQIDNTVFVEETEEVKASRRKKSDLVIPELSAGKIDFEWEIKPMAKSDAKTNGATKNGKTQKGLFD